jgi:8-oxo-dGTP pyrophosphatase MutT (NUDIX family)
MDILNDEIITTPPRDAASVVMLRDGSQGLEVLLLRRHADSDVLGGAYVFPGGKVDAVDSAPDLLAHLDHAPADLLPQLDEADLNANAAAALFVAAAREAFEESGLLYARRPGTPMDTPARHAGLDAIKQGQPFGQWLRQHDLRLDTRDLVPWSRWVTPRQPSIMNKRFDTRFFLAAVPPQQEALCDDFEVTEARWFTPREALRQYSGHAIDLAPPQIVSLLHLAQWRDAAQALAAARARRPPLIQPKPLESGGTRVLCYPGDPEHPVRERALPEPVPTRMLWRNKRFEPPQGFAAWIE